MNNAQTPSHRDILRAAHDWRTRLSEPRVTQDELAQFQAWMNADARHEAAYDRAETLYQALGSLSEDDLGPDVMKPSWRERLPAWLFSPASGGVARYRLAGSMAALLMTVSLVWVLIGPEESPVSAPKPESVAFSTAVGEIRTITLAEGSTVTLGAKTSLTVSLEAHRRRVTLDSGAALFDVVADPDRPFTVAAGRMQATVLGTRFDVRQSGDVSRIAVAEGEVGVRYPLIIGGQSTSLESRATLTAGRQVAATPTEGLRDIEPIAINSVAAWQTKRVVYAGATLAELVADARRHADVTIDVRDPAGVLDAAKVTVFFDGNDVEGMLNTLPDILPVSVQRTSLGGIEIQPLP